MEVGGEGEGEGGVYMIAVGLYSTYRYMIDENNDNNNDNRNNDRNDNGNNGWVSQQPQCSAVVSQAGLWVLFLLPLQYDECTRT